VCKNTRIRPEHCSSRVISITAQDPVIHCFFVFVQLEFPSVDDFEMFKLIALIIIALEALSPRLKADFWAEPIPFFNDKIQEQYLAPASKFGTGHRGVDFKLAPFGEISAPATGTLAFAGKVVDRNVVTLKTEVGLASFEPACTQFEVGEQIERGEPFAIHCPADAEYEYHCENCVHFSVRDSFGYLSPMQLIEPQLPSVLVA